MRVLLCAMLTLLAALPLRAGDAKPNKLTSGEINAGWLLLFDGATPFGWTIDGDAKADQGTLLLGGPTRPTTAVLPGAFRDFELHFESQGKGRFIVDSGVRQDGLELAGPTRGTRLKVVGGAEGVTAAGQASSSLRGSQPVEITVGYDPRRRPVCRFEVAAGEQVKLTKIKLRPLGLTSIFSGKDLTGWKEHPGRKSKFSVTKEGWLNVKDGPGDLQTKGQWGDFVLQLECVSNGEHLNSGIFFRCRPGEYQQGYEAQIRNQFTEQPTQAYTVEDYDPKAGELTGKRKVMSPAVDYGTGAIYRRQPARLGVSKDGAWFTLTLVAHGRHLATWVNGIQVADWTDHRKLSDNARNGCRLEKGPISIQGHDPTTDLSFRNIRIAELPPAK